MTHVLTLFAADQQKEIATLRNQLDHANKVAVICSSSHLIQDYTVQVIESERSHLNFALEKLGMRRLDLLESMSSSRALSNTLQSSHEAPPHSNPRVVQQSTRPNTQDRHDWNIPVKF